MKVSEAIEKLMEFPLESDLVICAHEFNYGGDIAGWHISHFEPTHDGAAVMIEGAAPPRPNLEPTPDDQQ